MSRIGFIAILVVLSITIEQSHGFACTRTLIPGVYRIDTTVTATGKCKISIFGVPAQGIYVIQYDYVVII